MDFTKLRNRAQEAASRAQETALKVAESEQAVAARHLAAAQIARLGPRLTEVIDLDDEQPLTPEILVMKVIRAVHDDDEVERSLKDVRGTGKRNERLAAAAGIVGGGIGCIIADLYADAALYWMLADCFDLEVSDGDVAAHLLVAWGAIPDHRVARAVMDPAAEVTIADVARRRFQEGALELVTKRDSVQALWRLRSGIARVPLFDLSTFHDVFFVGKALQQRLDTAALQLGLSAGDVRKPSLIQRIRRR
jgi:hypothetical protein